MKLTTIVFRDAISSPTAAQDKTSHIRASDDVSIDLNETTGVIRIRSVKAETTVLTHVSNMIDSCPAPERAK